MKKCMMFLFVSALIVLSGCSVIDSVNHSSQNDSPSITSGTATIPNYNPGDGGWILVWSDEFNGTALDTSVWNYDIGNNGNGNIGWGNSEAEYYTDRPQNVRVENGKLVITALQESYGGQNYTSGRINTKGKYSFKYGKIVARIKLPYAQGMWPAFWMLGNSYANTANNWPRCGEMDIVESVGGTFDQNNGAENFFWYNETSAATENQVSGYKFANRGISRDDYHIFEAEWNEQFIQTRIDGVAYNSPLDITISERSEFQQNFFILLNIAVGGPWPGYPDASTVFPQNMYVDWVKVYQKTGTPKEVPILSGSIFKLTTGSGDLALSANGLAENNTVVLNAYAQQNTQFWKVEDVGDGYYKLVLDGEDFCLAVDNASTAGGASVVLQTFTGADNQLWKIEKIAEGSFRLTAKHSGLVLSVQDGPSAGNQAVQSADSGASGQRWNISFVPDIEIHLATVNFEYPSSGSILGNKYVFTGLATAYNGIEGVYLSLDGGPWIKAEGTTKWSCLLDFTSGSHTVVAYTQDLNGNISIPKTITFTGAANEAQFTIDGDCYGKVSGVTMSEYKINVWVIGPWGAYIRPDYSHPDTLINSDGSWSCNTWGYPSDQCHILQAQLISKGSSYSTGDVIATFRYIRNDAIAPTLTVSTPLSTVDQPVLGLSGSAGDNREIGGVYVSLNGSKFQFVPGSSVYLDVWYPDIPKTVNWQTNLVLSPGINNQVRVFAKDDSQHFTATNSYTVYYDNTAVSSIFVSTNGNDANLGTKTSPFATVQKGVDEAVSSGRTNVYLSQGVYTPGNGLNGSMNGVNISNNGIHLSGGWNLAFTANSGVTVLDASRILYHVIRGAGATNIVIDHLIVSNAVANGSGENSDGAGIYFTNVHNSIIECDVVSNYALKNGAGICVMNGTGNSISGTIMWNISDNAGGGVYVSGDSNTIGGIVDWNSVWGPVGGGGIYLAGNSNTISCTRLSINETSADGAGAFVVGDYNLISSMYIYCNINGGYNGGGGVYLIGNNNVFSGKSWVNHSHLHNDGNLSYGGGCGGGLFVSGNNNVINGDLDNNEAEGFGGGVYIYRGTNNSVNALIFCNYANTHGGGVYVDEGVSNTVGGNIFINETYFGGGVYINGGSYNVINGTIVGNKANQVINSDGGGIYINDSSHVSIINAVLTNNRSTTSNNTIVLRNNGHLDNLIISNCLIGGNEASSYAIIECAPLWYDQPAQDVNGQILMNNTFITNRLGYLYNDFVNGLAAINELGSKVNSAVWSGAVNASGNSAIVQ